MRWELLLSAHPMDTQLDLVLVPPVLGATPVIARWWLRVMLSTRP